MTSTESSADRFSGPQAQALPSRVATRFIRARLAAFQAGSIDVTLPDGSVVRHQGSAAGPHADLVLHKWRVLWRIVTDGDLGLARAYIDGDCDSSDIRAVLALGAVNAAALTQAVPSSRVGQVFERLRHWRRRNSRPGSRRNIAAHYDLGNAFYEQWLDAGKNYSSAIYSDADHDLEQAQAAKLRRVAELLDLAKGEQVLEIGCGWGALAERLVLHHDCSVTGITLSTEQLAYARQRLAATPRAQAADFRLQDYRDVDGRFDRIVSVEMFEAVGERYWPVYFEKLRRCLADNGVAVLQVITIADSRFEAYRRQPDFIQRYIFPGGMLPTGGIVANQAAQAGLRLVSHHEFGDSYSRTLAEWRRRFLQAWPNIEALGFDTRFKRMWEYYLTYCEVAFEQGLINVGLFKLTTDGGADPAASIRP